MLTTGFAIQLRVTQWGFCYLMMYKDCTSANNIVVGWAVISKGDGVRGTSTGRTGGMILSDNVLFKKEATSREEPLEPKARQIHPAAMATRLTMQLARLAS